MAPNGVTILISIWISNVCTGCPIFDTFVGYFLLLQDLQLNDVRNAVKSYTLSKKYVNRLVKITVLNVLYHRIEIPRNEFEKRDFDNVPYVSFIKHSKNNFIRIFTAAATGIIDAIEKDYVSILLLPHITQMSSKYHLPECDWSKKTSWPITNHHFGDIAPNGIDWHPLVSKKYNKKY